MQAASTTHEEEARGSRSRSYTTHTEEARSSRPKQPPRAISVASLMNEKNVSALGYSLLPA